MVLYQNTLFQFFEQLLLLSGTLLFICPYIYVYMYVYMYIHMVSFLCS